MRFQDGRLRSATPAELANSPIVKGLEDVKYLEVPTTHNIHMIHHNSGADASGTASGSRVGPGAGISIAVGPVHSPQPTWTHSRNLPKREQKHPFFQHLHKQLEMRASGSGGGVRNLRANNDLYEMRKMNEPTSGSLQSSTQVCQNNKGINKILLPNHAYMDFNSIRFSVYSLALGDELGSFLS